MCLSVVRQSSLPRFNETASSTCSASPEKEIIEGPGGRPFGRRTAPPHFPNPEAFGSLVCQLDTVPSGSLSQSE